MCVLCIKLVIATTVTGDMQCVYVRGDDYVYSFKVAFNMQKCIGRIACAKIFEHFTLVRSYM